MKKSFRHIIAVSFLLSLSWTAACVRQAQQAGSAPAAENLKFQPQLVTRTVRVINPPPRGSVTTTLKATELAPGASGQAKLKMGEVEVTVEAQVNGLAAPAGFGAQFETYMVWAITPAGKAVKIASNGSQRKPVRVGYQVCRALLRDRGDC
ncbi:MAG TPA: hypothetical protein VMG82_03090 [Candidatus Sulfotelmatobacter sp.]|nr:hypothetical protein [Candidatus Sulfotelmatobacter sp.]